MEKDQTGKKKWKMENRSHFSAKKKTRRSNRIITIEALSKREQKKKNKQEENKENKPTLLSFKSDNHKQYTKQVIATCGRC